jgi:histidyl-tRNA synthetase
MTKLNVMTPSGFPEFAPAAEALRQQWLKKVEQVFALHGFGPVTTPMVEREENLVAKGGNPKEMYVLKRYLDEDYNLWAGGSGSGAGNADGSGSGAGFGAGAGNADGTGGSHSGNAMRFDHTVPLALYTVRHLNDIAFPFRRYAIGPVFRGERAQKGRYRQFTQCDIDIIGNATLGLGADMDVLLAAYEVYAALDLGKVVFRVNNRKLLIGALREFGVTDDAQMKTVLDVVDNRDKIGDAKTLVALEQAGIENAAGLLRFGELRGDYATVLNEVKTLVSADTFAEGGAELETLMAGLEASGADMDGFELDMGIARGLDYYTGMVVEAQLVAHPEFRTIGAGGRYDNLVGVFSSKAYPGVGFSLGLTRLFAQCLEAGLIEPNGAQNAEVMGMVMEEKYAPMAQKIAANLRKNGIAVMVYTEGKKMSKQFDYAQKLGIGRVFIIGEDEARDGTVVVKNLKNRTQEIVGQEDLGTFLKHEK